MLKEILGASLAALQLAVGTFTGTATPEEMLLEEKAYIIHAAGTIDGVSGTNSLEALENAYNEGNRFIEIDFNFSYDLQPVCIHDWNYVSFPGYESVAPLYSQFKAGKVYGTFTPLTLESVAEYMTWHEDLYVVTDVKDYNIYFSGIIQKKYPLLLDRFIIQVYSEQQYDYISKMGFDKIIFSLYKLDWKKQLDTEYLAEFSKSHKLYAYTFNAELCEVDGYLDGMKKCGVPLFVHTVNDKEKQKKYFEMGISGIYTDNVSH